MKIFKSDNTLLIDVEVNDSSYRFRELMGKDELNLEFSLPVYLEIPLGCHCSFQNQEYELLQPSNVTVKHRREFEYQVLFEASWGRMRRWVVTNRVDGSVEFPLTAKPVEHLNQLVWNLNQRDGEGTWSAGACIDAPEAVISYAFTKCDKALADIAATFNCEWEIVGHTISLHRLEYNKNNPLRLEYGSNKGFRSGVKRTNDGDSLPIGTLYVQGSEKNIDFSSYPSSSEHSKRLLLPRGVTVNFDGEHFSDESGYDSTKAMTFVTDDKGYSVKRINSPHGTNTNEDSIDLSSIYPKRIGTVSAVKYIYDGDSFSYDELMTIAGLDWDKVQIDVIDDSIPDSLDYWADDVRIEGEAMTMVFQNGMLAGKEFDIQKFYKNADEFRLGNRFEIVRTEIDGICMPNATYRVYGRDEVAGKEATTYVIFNCSLPKSYITEAEKELLREALKFLYVHQDPKFSFTGDLDTMWAKRNWLNVGSRLVIGGYVNFVDKSLAPAPEPQDVGVLVRIISVKDYVNNPYCPTIELSTSTQAKSLSTALRKVENEHVVTDEKIEDSTQLSKRSFRNALETSRMLDEALESFKGEFSESVTPITVRTMSLLVGSENLQFKFIKSFTNLTDAPCPIHWDKNAKQLIYDESYLQHITLGVDDIAPKAGRTYDEYYIWRMNSGASAILADELVHTPFYVYAKVPVYNKATATEAQRVGDFIISKTAIGKDDVTGFHHLLCGTLSSETEGERSFARLYGFTEVLPGQITTDVIRSSDGLAFFDLINKAFKLGDKLSYNINESGELVLNGAFVQTGSGDISSIGAYCGEWDENRVYKNGDEVWKNVNNVVSTYRYVNSVPTKGHDVTDLSYWMYVAQGVKGEKGADGQSTFKSIVFKRTNSTPAKPTGGSYSGSVPEGWSDGIPEGTAQLWMSTRIFASDGKSPQESEWTTPRPATDTADIDFEYSAVESNPGTPSTVPANWHNSATSSDIWMAVRKCKNGVWGTWEVNKIKGEKGTDGESPVFADLDNEMEGVALNAQGKTTAQVQLVTNVALYFGTTALALTDISVSGLTTGITESHVLGTGKITFTIANGASVGANVPIAITLTGKYGQVTYTRNLTFTIAGVKAGVNGQDGQDGADGADGADAVIYSILPSVSSVKKNKAGAYSVNDVSCTRYKRVGSGALQTTTDGTLKYKLDNGTEQNYTSAISAGAFTTSLTFLFYIGTTLVDKETVPLIYDGTDGQNGKDGHDGSDGSDGVGISSTEVRYQKSTSGTTVPTGTWSASIPVLSAGEYLWTRLVVNYTSGSPSTSYSVSRNGTNGADGTNGRDGKDGTNGKDGSPGAPGKDGSDGRDGSDGVGISSYIIDYQEGSNGTTVPTGTWTTRLSDVTVRAGFYLWTRTRVTLTNGTTSTSYSNARQGLDGAKGADGVSPACPYSGNWRSDGVYYGMGNRTDIVFFSKADYSDGTNLYYVAKTTVGGPIPAGVKPTNTAYWSTFGANFDNIATGFAFIEQLVVRQLNTAGEGSSTKRIVAEGNTLAMYDDSNNKKMSISGENLVPAGESASYTYNSETIVSRTHQMWPSSGGEQIEQDGAEHTISVVSGNIVVITTPKITLNAGDTSGYPPPMGAFTFVLSAFLKYNGKLKHLNTIGGAIAPSSATVKLTVDSRKVTLTLPSGDNKIELFVRVSLGGQNFDPYGDYYYMNVTTESWGAEVTYGAQSVDIGANGLRAMFGSSYMFQAIKTGSDDSTIEMLMRAGNYGVKTTSSGLQFLIGGSWYAASRVYDSTISGYVLKLG